MYSVDSNILSDELYEVILEKSKILLEDKEARCEDLMEKINSMIKGSGKIGTHNLTLSRLETLLSAVFMKRILLYHLVQSDGNIRRIAKISDNLTKYSFEANRLIRILIGTGELISLKHFENLE